MGSFAELVEQSRASAGADSNWLGSERHRTLLADSLPSALGISNVTLTWAPPGSASFWQPSIRQLSLERPVPSAVVSVGDLAELTALGLLHECLHIRHTMPAERYAPRRFAVPPSLEQATARLFNLLEDGRITALGVAADPELEQSLNQFITAAADQLVSLESSKLSLSQRNELFFAVQLYALAPDRGLTLDPAVQNALVALRPIMDEARRGSTEDADAAAVDVVAAVMQTPLT